METVVNQPLSVFMKENCQLQTQYPAPAAKIHNCTIKDHKYTVA